MPLIQGKSKKSFGKNVGKEMEAGKPQKQALAIAFSVQRKNKKKMADGGTLGDAIGYPGSKKKYYDGGEVLDADSTGKDSTMMIRNRRAPLEHAQELDFHDEKRSDADDAEDEREMDMLAEGGEIEDDLRKEKKVSIDDQGSERDEDMLDSHPLRHAEEKLAGTERPVADDAKTDRDEDMLRAYARGGRIAMEDEMSKEKHASVAAAIMAKKKFADGGEVDLQENADEDLNKEDQLSYEAARKKTYYDDSQLDEQPLDSNEDGRILPDEDEHAMDMISKIRSKMKSKKMI